MSNFYIALYDEDLDGEDIDTIQYFDVDPRPIPRLMAERVTTNYQCVPEDLDTPGNKRTWDAGCALSNKVIELNFDYVTAGTAANLESKHNVISRVVYSPDNGVTKYICAWEGNNPLSLIPYDGAKSGACRGRLLLRVTGTIT